MLHYSTSDASGASNCPPASPNGGDAPRKEEVHHVLYGTLAALDRTVKILHVLGYAEADHWSKPLPVPLNGVPGTYRPGQWMVILTKTLLLE